MSQRLRLRLFGRAALISPQGALNITPLPKCLSALAYLALNSDRAVPRRELAFALWPDAGEETALGNLRRHLHALTNELPHSEQPWLLADRTTVGWNRDAPWSSDVEDFDRYCASPTHRADAIALYNDDLLLDVGDAWVEAYREQYRQHASSALTFLAVQYWMHHDMERGIECMRQLLRLQPFDENALCRAMAMLYQSGDRADALKVYADFEGRLKAEVAAEPMASSVALAQAIRSDLEAVAFPTNLPAHLTAFLGRDEELTQLGKLLETTRLLSLIGTGGIGKTRLALELASLQAALYRDGVFLADLSYVTGGDEVARVVAEAAGLPLNTGPVVDSLQRHLQKKSLLLVFDNCEHVIDECARLAERLLRAAPHIRILATSREALRLSGEVTWRVPPLTSADAQRLFAARAPMGEALTEDPRSLPLIDEICSHVDSLPLAIELAAAATDAMSLADLLAQLRLDASLTRLASRSDTDRHRTLRATVEWSFTLLDPEDRRLFLELTIFSGGWTLEAAQAVCGQNQTDVAAILQRLVDRSMVQFAKLDGSARYRLLETIRAFALERRQSDGDDASLTKRHATFFYDMANAAEPHLRGPQQATWLDRLDAELENIRTGLVWSFARSPELAISFVRALRKFFEIRGYYAEGRRWLESAISASPAPSTDRIDCLNSLGNIESYSGAVAAALAQYAAAEELAREASYRKGLLQAIMGRGYVLMHRVSREAARPVLQEALELLQAAGDDQHATATTLGNIAFIEMQDGELGSAEAHYREASAIFEGLGDRRQGAWIGFQLGRIAFHGGDFVTAESLTQSSLDVRREFGDRRGIVESSCGLGAIALAQSAADRALELFVQASRLSDEIDWKRGVAISEEGLAAAAVRRGDHAEAARRFENAEAFRKTFNVPIEPIDQAAHDALWKEIRATAPAEARTTRGGTAG
jgi:predicted ATPase/DNA-binding SARP family transcriptional activator